MTSQDKIIIEASRLMPLSVASHEPLSRALELCAFHPEIRLLPVVDAANRPVGAIYEEDIRRLLFNPYGYALLQNPTFGRTVEAYIRPCIAADINFSVSKLLDLYTRENASDGMIVTRDGLYIGLIESEHLLRLAAEMEAHRADQISQSVAAFQKEIYDLAATLGDVASQLSSVAATNLERSKETGERAGDVAVAAAQVKESMSAMARESDLFATTLNHLHSATATAKTKAQTAVSLVHAGTERTSTLVERTRSIENVLELIQSLASKVNLLALNASIEAARAGEHGLGFAVVAREIKNLADQTREAASLVAGYVRDIDTAVNSVAISHDGIESAISDIDAYAESVEMTVASHKVSSRTTADNISQIACASDEISSNISQISQESGKAATKSADAMQFAGSLSNLSVQLQDHVARFIGAVR